MAFGVTEEIRVLLEESGHVIKPSFILRSTPNTLKTCHQLLFCPFLPSVRWWLCVFSGKRAPRVTSGVQLGAVVKSGEE